MLPENRAGYRPNTILHGHRRVKACLLNGETEVTVRVRYDLADADWTTIEKEFLLDNLNRQQLDPWAKARVARRLFQLELGRKRSKRNTDEETDARDRVGKLVGMSGRHLQRLWNILDAPVAVQDALRAKKLRVVDAAKVADLESGKQMKIARELARARTRRP